MVDHGCHHLQCCNWLPVQLLQQGGDVDGPGVASRPPHDEMHRLRVVEIHLRVLDLESGHLKNVLRRVSIVVLAIFTATNWNTTGTSC